MEITLATALNYYKRKDIQDAMVSVSPDKEVVGSFGGKGFGSRPDTLQYPNDILESVKQGITSFHMSEEHWFNPQRLSPNLRKQEINDLRKGWDLVIDVDCPEWEVSKIVTDSLIREIKKHGVKSVSCKFSGNKGFHIAVPFSSFPSTYGDTKVTHLFPDACRQIAQYLVHLVSKNPEFIAKLSKFTSLERYSESIKKYCKRCHKIVNENLTKQFFYNCTKCGNTLKQEEDKNYITCPKCTSIAKKDESSFILCPHCKENLEIEENADMSALMEVDTVLISTRHLYRMPYSLHEKSGLLSIPIDSDRVLDFDKKEASPENPDLFKHTFLDPSSTNPGEARHLLEQAYAQHVHSIDKKHLEEKTKKEVFSLIKSNQSFEDIAQAIPQDFFPPCIKAILSGLEDGRKRALFILINFLSSCNYPHEQIEEMLHKWNKNNRELLREVYLVGQLRYHKQHGKKVLPPNCPHTGKPHYNEIGVCQPDNLCPKIKNPVQYAKKRAWLHNNATKTESRKWSDEKKEKMAVLREERKKFKEDVKKKIEAGDID
jgi:DNA primase catalytic subunit